MLISDCTKPLLFIYYSNIRSLYLHVVCDVLISCKANKMGINQFGAWLYSDLIAEIIHENLHMRSTVVQRESV